MRIRSIMIGSFGNIKDLEIHDLSPNLNVVYGKNETGKTTIMEFIRSTLFPNRQRKTYPTYSKTDSGRLTIEMSDGSVVSFERGKDPILKNIDPSTYRSVFAMTPEDLRDSTIISSGDIKKRFLTIPGGRDLPLVSESIEKERLELLTTDRRSSNTVIGSKMSELEGIRSEISSLSERNDEYDRLF